MKYGSPGFRSSRTEKALPPRPTMGASCHVRVASFHHSQRTFTLGLSRRVVSVVSGIARSVMFPPRATARPIPTPATSTTTMATRAAPARREPRARLPFAPGGVAAMCPATISAAASRAVTPMTIHSARRGPPTTPQVTLAMTITPSGRTRMRRRSIIVSHSTPMSRA